MSRGNEPRNPGDYIDLGDGEESKVLMSPATLTIDVSEVFNSGFLDQPICPELQSILKNLLQSELAPRVLGMKFLGKSWKDVVARSEIAGLVLGTLTQITSIIYADAKDLTPQEQSESAETVKAAIGIACACAMLVIPIVHNILSWLEKGRSLEGERAKINSQIEETKGANQSIIAPKITKEIYFVLKNLANEQSKDSKLLTLGTTAVVSAGFGLATGSSFFASAGYAGIAKLAYDYFNQDPHAMTPDKFLSNIIEGNKDINSGKRDTQNAEFVIKLEDHIKQQVAKQKCNLGMSVV